MCIRDSYGITISANVLADNFGGGVELRDAWGCAVSANTFTIDAVRALWIGPNSGRITVTGNSFSDSYIGDKARRLGDKNRATGIILQETTDIVISGNLFSGLAQQAVRSEGKCRRLAITGNILIDMNRASEEKLPALNLGQVEDCLIENNLFEKGLKP